MAQQNEIDGFFFFFYFSKFQVCRKKRGSSK